MIEFLYYDGQGVNMKRICAVILLSAALFFSCELYDETAATVNFWDFKNAVVKDREENPDSFIPADFADTELTADLIGRYGTGSRFALSSEKQISPARLLLGTPENDYFGYQYYYKYYTDEKPLKSALGTWTGSVLYVVYSAVNPVLNLISGGAVETIFCAFWAEAERENQASPGKIVVKVDMDGGTKMILDGYSYWYPRVKEGEEIQRVNGANLEGMYMTGFDVIFLKGEAEGEAK